MTLIENKGLTNQPFYDIIKKKKGANKMETIELLYFLTGLTLLAMSFVVEKLFPLPSFEEDF